MYSAVFFLAGGLIYLYRENLLVLSRRYRWILLAGLIGITIIYYMVSDSIPVMILLFSVLLIYAIGSHGGVLENPFTVFISGVSMEIYLCHMVVFRAIERFGMLHLFSSDVLSYITAAIFTIGGAIVFAKVTQWGLLKL